MPSAVDRLQDQDHLQILALLHLFMCIIKGQILISKRRRTRRVLMLTNLAHRQRLNRVNRGPYCNLGTAFLLTALQNGSLDLRKDFRVSRRSFVTLVNIVRDDKQHGWQREIEVLLFLFWLACGCAYRVVTRSCGVPTTTICRVVHKQLNAITENLHKFIHLPKPEEYNNIAQGFSNLCATPAIGNAVGAIDGTHVRIIPPSERRASYINRKCQLTLQTQAVCNHEGVFIDVFTGFPGSVHDARVYRNSPLVTNRVFPPCGYYLLGDSAYPGSATLLSPFKEPEAANPVNRRFNYHHSKGRSIIERAFGQLKVRWRCIFTKDIELRSALAPHVIAACCAMHNLCHASGDIWIVDDDDDQPAEQEDGDEQEIADNAAGINMRTRMAQLISAPDEYPQHLDEHDYCINIAHDVH